MTSNTNDMPRSDTPPSLWHDQAPLLSTRDALSAGSHTFDVAIVGGGFTGLWTAFHLQVANPTLRIGIIEAEHIGFGASGRNGGWCIAELAASHERWAALSDEAGASALDVALHESVDQIESTIVEHSIDCDFARGGELHLARNGGQEARLRKMVDDQSSFWLSKAEAEQKCGATAVRGGLFIPSTAALHPAKLVRSLANLVETRGATIFERTRATDVGPRKVVTGAATVTAKHVVLATEGYTATLNGRQRDLIPLSSMMVATEPLAPEMLEEIKLHDRPVFADGRFVVIYGQRTADDRIAFGGRTTPYRFGSKIPATRDYDDSGPVERVLFELFPVLKKAEITHRWGGVLGVPRNWTPYVSIDADNRLLIAGGYVGEGVAATHLAGRVMAAAITGSSPELLRLPLVRSASRPWPVEPFRWTGVLAGARIFDVADHFERRTNHPATLATAAVKVLRR